MFDMRPLYAKLSILDLSNNNVEGLHTIGSAAKVLKKNGPISSKLECLYLDNNPALNSLNSPETPDHDAMVCLLKTCPKLHRIQLKDHLNDPSSATYSSIIKYWMMINKRRGCIFAVDFFQSRVQSLVEQHPNPLNIMHIVLELANQREDEIFNLLHNWFPDYLSSLYILSDEDKRKAEFVHRARQSKRLNGTIEGLNTDVMRHQATIKRLYTGSMRQQATIEHQLNRINDLENRQLQNQVKQIFLMISRLLKCKRRRPDEEQTTGE